MEISIIIALIAALPPAVASVIVGFFHYKKKKAEESKEINSKNNNNTPDVVFDRPFYDTSIIELSRGKQVKHNMPSRNMDFTGREKDLNQISTYFQTNNKVILFGTGGIGKSQIAFEYAYRNMTNYQYLWVVDAEFIEKSYREFATRFGLPSANNESLVV